MTLLISGGFAVIVVTSLALIVRALLHKGQPSGWQEILAIYFYLVSVISLLGVVSGGAMLTKALSSNAYGRAFSYQSFSVASPQPAGIGTQDIDSKLLQQEKAAQAVAAQQEKLRIEQAYQDDIFTGVSTLVVGVLFLFVHILGSRKIQQGQDWVESFWYRGYILLQLIMYGLIVLVSLPMAISQTLRFFIMNAGTNAPQPGEVLGIALWSTPVWVVFVWLALRMSRRLPNTDLKA